MANSQSLVSVLAFVFVLSACPGSEDDGGGSSNTGVNPPAAGSGGAVAGTGGTTPTAGTGGAVAGTGGTPAGGTGGAAAGTGGSAAGGTGGAAAGTGGSAAGTGGGTGNACETTFQMKAGTRARPECGMCICAVDAVAVDGCNQACVDLALCVRDKGCYKRSGSLDILCAQTMCGPEVTASGDMGGYTQNTFKPIVDMGCGEACDVMP